MNNQQQLANLEILPNEILIECFKYFDAFDLFHSFNQLNTRFNHLIRHIPLCLVIKSVNKTLFDRFCTELIHNPQIKIQVRTLKLSTVLDREAVAVGTFLSLFSLDEFPNIRNFESTIDQRSLLFKKIYSKLHCNIELIDLFRRNFHSLSIPKLDSSLKDFNGCSSIINLTIVDCYLTELSNLLPYTPLLKYLFVGKVRSLNTQSAEIPFNDKCSIHLKELIIEDYADTFDVLKKFIQQTPNLKRLTINADHNNDMLSAMNWEELITSSLSYLNVFKFCFTIFNSKEEREQLLDKFQQFQTDFWREQHQWYTKYGTDTSSTCIYTIPLITNNHCLSDDNISCSKNSVNGIKIYNNVTQLVLPRDDPIKSSILLNILKEAPQVSSLVTPPENLQEFFSDKELCKYLNKMIKELLLLSPYYELGGDEYFNADQICQMFTNIEHLVCALNHHDSLLFLINHLPRLVTLQVDWRSYRDDLILFEEKASKLNMIHIVHSSFCFDQEDYFVTIYIWLGKPVI